MNKPEKEYSLFLVTSLFEQILLKKLKDSLKSTKSSIYSFFKDNISLKSKLKMTEKQNKKLETVGFDDFETFKFQHYQCLILLDHFYTDQIYGILQLYNISYLVLRFRMESNQPLSYVDDSKTMLIKILNLMEILNVDMLIKLNDFNHDSVLSLTSNIVNSFDSNKKKLNDIIKTNLDDLKKSNNRKLKEIIQEMNTSLEQKFNSILPENEIHRKTVINPTNQLSGDLITITPASFLHSVSLNYYEELQNELKYEGFKVLFTDIDDISLICKLNWNIIINLNNEEINNYKYLQKKYNELNDLDTSHYEKILDSGQSCYIIAFGAKSFITIKANIVNYFGRLKKCLKKNFQMNFFKIFSSIKSKEILDDLWKNAIVCGLEEEDIPFENTFRLINIHLRDEKLNEVNYVNDAFILNRRFFHDIISPLHLPEEDITYDKYKPVYSENHINYLRYYFVLNFVGVKVLTTILLKHIKTKLGKNIRNPVETFFKNNRSDFVNSLSKNHFNNDQYNIIYPNSTAATNTLEGFDISLCIAVFRNLTEHKDDSAWNEKWDSNSDDFVSCLLKLYKIRNKFTGHLGSKTMQDVKSDDLMRYDPKKNFADNSKLGKIEFCILKLFKNEPNFHEIKMEINKYVNEDISNTNLDDILKCKELEKEQQIKVLLDQVHTIQSYNTKIVSDTTKDLVKAKNQLEKANNQLQETLKNNYRTELFDSKYLKIEFNKDIKHFLSIKENSSYFKILVLCNCDSYNFEEKNQIAEISTVCDWNILVDLGRKSLNTNVNETNELYDSIKKKLNSRNRKVKLIISNDKNYKLDPNDLSAIRTCQQMLYLMVNGCENLNVPSPSNSNDLNLYVSKHLSKILREIDHLKIVYFNLFINSQVTAKKLCSNLTYSQATIEITNQIVNALDNNNIFDSDFFYLINIIPIDKDEDSQVKRFLFDNFDSLSGNIKTTKENSLSQNENLRFCDDEFSMFVQKVLNLKAHKDCNLILPDNWHFNNYSDYSQVIEIYHTTIGTDILEESEEKKEAITIEYLKGNKITPDVIFLNEDGNYITCIKRDILSKIEQDIRENIGISVFSNNCYVIEYEHSSGATTLGCLLLYKFHKEHPCFLIKDLNQEDKLLDAIKTISLNTQPKTLIILLDDNISREVIELSRVVRFSQILASAKHKSCIIFLKKNMKNPKSLDKKNMKNTKSLDKDSKMIAKQYFLSRELTKENEESSFKSLFERFTKNPLNRLKKVHLYGLFSFEKGYVDRIDSIIRETFQQLTLNSNNIKTALFMVAMVKKYANSTFSARLLALMLNLRTNDLLENIDMGGEYSELLNFLALNYKKEFTTYHSVVTDSLEKIVIEELNHPVKIEQKELEKQGLQKFYDLIIELINLSIEKNNTDYINNICDLLKLLFISYKKKNDDHLTLLVDNLKKHFEEETSQMISQLIENIKVNQIFNLSIYPFLEMVLGKFCFYEMKDKIKGLNTIKKVFYPKISLSSNLCDNMFLVKNSNAKEIHQNIFTAYAHMIKAFLNDIYKNTPNEKNLSLDQNLVSTKNIENKQKFDFEKILTLADDAINSYEKAREKTKEYSDFDVTPFIGEIRLRYSLIEFYFKYNCRSDQSQFTAKLANTDFKLIKESENKVKELLDRLERMIIRHNTVLEDKESKVFNLSYMILKFRLDSKEIFKIIENNQSIDTYIDMELLLKQCGFNWSNLSEQQLKSIIDRCVIQIESYSYFYSSFKDLIFTIMYAQKFEELSKNYGFEKAFTYSDHWIKNFPNEPDPYFYHGIFKLVHAVKIRSIKSIEYIKQTNLNYFKNCREKSKVHVTKDKYIKDYLGLKYCITKEDGLNSLQIFDPSTDNEKLEVFNGRFKQTDGLYYVYVSKDDDNFENNFKAYYQPVVSLHSLLQTDLDSGDLFEFNLLIRRDKIYVIYPKKRI